MAELLVDSVIFIDHFNGVSQATAFLRETAAVAAISVITRSEVLAGFGGAESTARAKARALLDRFPALPITVAIADQAAELRYRNRWKLPDALQASVALHHGLRLATRDAGDFPPDRHEFVVIPYRLPAP